MPKFGFVVELFKMRSASTKMRERALSLDSSLSRQFGERIKDCVRLCSSRDEKKPQSCLLTLTIWARQLRSLLGIVTQQNSLNQGLFIIIAVVIILMLLLLLVWMPLLRLLRGCGCCRWLPRLYSMSRYIVKIHVHGCTTTTVTAFPWRSSDRKILAWSVSYQALSQ